MLKKGILIALLAMIVDQVHKYWMLHVLGITEGQSLTVTSFFNLVLVWNKGVSFGMFNHGEVSPYQPILLSILSIVVVAVLFAWLKKSESNFQTWGLGLVIGGALGNVVDRAIYGAVADFLDFHMAGYHWPAFNFADSFICVGVFILVLEGIFDIKKTK